MGDDEADPTASGPIFIVGSMGSGSTLLRLMLDSHPNIAIPGETGFLRLVLAHTQIPYWRLGDQWYGNLGMSEADLFARLRAFYGSMFADAATVRGKTRWGDKTPFHVWNLQLAAQVFPDCRVVGIVRHPGAVIASLRTRFRYDARRATQHWEITTKQLVMASMELGERCALIRYEDLVRNPEPVMRAVLAHVGEPWSADVLTHDRIQAGDGAPLESEGFTRVDRPLDPARLSGWETRLGAKAKRELHTAAPLAGFLGYDVARTFPLGDLTDPPRALLTGRDLRARRRTSPGSVDWSRWPVPTLGNAPLLPGERVGAVTGADRPAPAPATTRVRKRLIAVARRVLPERARLRLQRLRRDRATIDRLVGPR